MTWRQWLAGMASAPFFMVGLPCMCIGLLVVLAFSEPFDAEAKEDG